MMSITVTFTSLKGNKSIYADCGEGSGCGVGGDELGVGGGAGEQVREGGKEWRMVTTFTCRSILVRMNTCILKFRVRKCQCTG